jgi:hypothetical protein
MHCELRKAGNLLLAAIASCATARRHGASKVPRTPWNY